MRYLICSSRIFGIYHQPAGKRVPNRWGQAVQQGHHPLLDRVEVPAPNPFLGLVRLQHAQVPWLCVLGRHAPMLVVLTAGS